MAGLIALTWMTTLTLGVTGAASLAVGAWERRPVRVRATRRSR